jgi:hypothetical protein
LVNYGVGLQEEIIANNDFTFDEKNEAKSILVVCHRRCIGGAVLRIDEKLGENIKVYLKQNKRK